MPCNRCGGCCKTVTVVYNNTRDVSEWCAARGFNIIQQTKRFIEVSIPHVCQYYNGHGCRIQNKKPLTCSGFPYAIAAAVKMGLDPQASLPRTCGFKWNKKRKVFD